MRLANNSNFHPLQHLRPLRTAARIELGRKGRFTTRSQPLSPRGGNGSSCPTADLRGSANKRRPLSGERAFSLLRRWGGPSRIITGGNLALGAYDQSESWPGWEYANVPESRCGRYGRELRAVSRWRMAATTPVVIAPRSISVRANRKSRQGWRTQPSTRGTRRLSCPPIFRHS
jgi:hypothetical protein